jgi:hypothetical protein
MLHTMKTAPPTDSPPKVVGSLLVRFISCLTFFGWANATLMAAPGDESGRFRTGRRLQAALTEHTSVAVTGATLLPMLRQIERDSEIAIILDRRIDPNSPLIAKTGFSPRIQVLKSILPTTPKMDVVATDRVVLVGPAGSTGRLPILLDWHQTVVNEVGKPLSARDRSRLKASHRTAFPELSEPREIIVEAAEQIGLSLRNPEIIPHDVWAAIDWPDMPFAELSSLVLVQFDLALQVTSVQGEIEAVAIHQLPPIDRKYVIGRKLKAQANHVVRKVVDASQLRWSGGTIIVNATLDQHAEILHRLETVGSADTGTSPSAWVPITRRTFSLKVERATVGAVIASFRTQNVPVEVVDEQTPEVAQLLRQPVRIDVTSEPAGTFFQKVFGQAFRSVEVLDDRVVLEK